jgi:hypothetical protein
MLVILRRFRKRNRLFPVLATPELGSMLYGKNGKKLTHFQLTIDRSAWTIDHRPSTIVQEKSHLGMAVPMIDDRRSMIEDHMVCYGNEP